MRRAKVSFNFLLLFPKLSSKLPLQIQREYLNTKVCLFLIPDNWSFFSYLQLKCLTFNFFPTVAMSIMGVFTKRELTGRRSVLVSAKGIALPSRAAHVSVSYTCQNSFFSFDQSSDHEGSDLYWVTEFRTSSPE